MDTEHGAMTTADPVVAEEKKPAKAARKPHTLDLVVDAITQNPDRKGVSVTAIKSHLAVSLFVWLYYDYCEIQQVVVSVKSLIHHV